MGTNGDFSKNWQCYDVNSKSNLTSKAGSDMPSLSLDGGHYVDFITIFICSQEDEPETESIQAKLRRPRI